MESRRSKVCVVLLFSLDSIARSSCVRRGVRLAQLAQLSMTIIRRVAYQSSKRQCTPYVTLCCEHSLKLSIVQSFQLLHQPVTSPPTVTHPGSLVCNSVFARDCLLADRTREETVDSFVQGLLPTVEWCLHV